MRGNLLLFIAFIFTFSTSAQNQLSEEKKHAYDEDGKLFIQKTLPVYLWLSTSKDSSIDKHLLTSKRTSQYANPMYFDADGYNSIRIKGQVNPQTKEVIKDGEVVFEVYGDNKPPESYTITQSKYVKFEDGKRVYKENCILDILSYDMFSGVEKIYYSINGKPFTQYSEQLNIVDEGDVLLNYYAVDFVGNIEEIKTLSFKIEK